MDAPAEDWEQAADQLENLQIASEGGAGDGAAQPKPHAEGYATLGLGQASRAFGARANGRYLMPQLGLACPPAAGPPRTKSLTAKSQVKQSTRPQP